MCVVTLGFMRARSLGGDGIVDVQESRYKSDETFSGREHKPTANSASSTSASRSAISRSTVITQVNGTPVQPAGLIVNLRLNTDNTPKTAQHKQQRQSRIVLALVVSFAGVWCVMVWSIWCMCMRPSLAHLQKFDKDDEVDSPTSAHKQEGKEGSIPNERSSEAQARKHVVV